MNAWFSYVNVFIHLSECLLQRTISHLGFIFMWSKYVLLLRGNHQRLILRFFGGVRWTPPVHCYRFRKIYNLKCCEESLVCTIIFTVFAMVLPLLRHWHAWIMDFHINTVIPRLNARATYLQMRSVTRLRSVMPLLWLPLVVIHKLSSQEQISWVHWKVNVNKLAMYVEYVMSAGQHTLIDTFSPFYVVFLFWFCTTIVSNHQSSIKAHGQTFVKILFNLVWVSCCSSSKVLFTMHHLHFCPFPPFLFPDVCARMSRSHLPDFHRRILVVIKDHSAGFHSPISGALHLSLVSSIQSLFMHISLSASLNALWPVLARQYPN